MSRAILITQCLQRDFVEPIGRHDPLPNLLHVGHEEARRLMGEDPANGPLQRVMIWACGLPDELLRVIHIRDWHDPEDSGDRLHLERFGAHCIRGSDGAAFVFSEPEQGSKRIEIIDSTTLNDFLDTPLAGLLEELRAPSVRVGLVGVWTEAKVTFLAYELATRFPELDLGVCSALTASSSRANHFIALDQLERLLGVTVFRSVGEFTEWLGGEAVPVPLVGYSEKHPELQVEGLDHLGEHDCKLLRYLYRDCRKVECRVLDGGFSGNVVLGTESVDVHGHSQVPHVVKIGPRDPMGQERTSFERIEPVLGNAAPRIADFADLGERGAIKYRYASMTGAFATTFQKRYMAGMPLEQVRRVLETVFREQLGRLYRAADRERCDLLEYYEFSSRWAPSVRRRVEALLGREAEGPTQQLEGGVEVANVCRFYEETIDALYRSSGSTHYLAFVHGDLNGANIILDRNDNVWLIDFFHAHRGHVLRDLIKLENDLLYIFTPIADDNELAAAYRLTDLLLEVGDLARAPGDPGPDGLGVAALDRALETVRILRSFYPELIHTDRDPIQLLIGQLRYAVHTLGFDESTRRQRLWALYTAGRSCERIEAWSREQRRLRVDWVDERLTKPGRLGITLLPGRRDRGRGLHEDIAETVHQGVTHLVSLVPTEELRRYGVGDLLDAARTQGLEVLHCPIVDQKVLSLEEMARLVGWIEQHLALGARVLITCVGGLGRSGMVAACVLRARGLDAAAAIAEVRRARSPRAVESALQEELVRSFGVAQGP